MKKVIKFLINDFKTDLIFLKQLFTGKYKITENKKEDLKHAFDIVGLFKENWLWVMIIILAFCVGWFCASQHYQELANNAIINFTQNCYDALNLTNNVPETLRNLTINLS